MFFLGPVLKITNTVFKAHKTGPKKPVLWDLIMAKTMVLYPKA